MTNEPTTGEIVRALRCVAEATECKDCRYKYPVGNVILCDHEQMNGNAADRLESQQREIAEQGENLKEAYELVEKLLGAIKEQQAKIDAEKARADAAVADFKVAEEDGLCCICTFIGNDIGQTKCMEDCCFKWRGLQPQEGGGNDQIEKVGYSHSK